MRKSAVGFATRMAVGKWLERFLHVRTIAFRSAPPTAFANNVDVLGFPIGHWIMISRTKGQSDRNRLVA